MPVHRGNHNMQAIEAGEAARAADMALEPCNHAGELIADFIAFVIRAVNGGSCLGRAWFVSPSAPTHALNAPDVTLPRCSPMFHGMPWPRSWASRRC
jgi:hypothetical protein